MHIPYIHTMQARCLQQQQSNKKCADHEARWGCHSGCADIIRSNSIRPRFSMMKNRQHMIASWRVCRRDDQTFSRREQKLLRCVISGARWLLINIWSSLSGHWDQCCARNWPPRQPLQGIPDNGSKRGVSTRTYSCNCVVVSCQ